MKKAHPYLFNEYEELSLEEVLKQSGWNKTSLFEKVYSKKEKNTSDKKYLSWVKHSLLFKEKKYSPESLLKNWTNDVENIVQTSWEQFFNPKDKICLVGMGKLGSYELNLSSDIDLIIFGEAGYINQVRDFIADMNGGVQIPSGFKLDFDLRPEGRRAPLVSKPGQLENHLWKNSDLWERYSYTRMREMVGNAEISEKVKKTAKAFCYRKYLSSDFFHYFLTLRESYLIKETDKGPHLKLGAGGIRDIELFTQTFQILYGGRDPSYHNKSTFELMSRFIKEDLHADVFEILTDAYIVLRQAEGLIHALNEEGGFVWTSEVDEDLSSNVFLSMKKAEDVIQNYVKSSNIFGNKKPLSQKSSFKKKIKFEVEKRKEVSSAGFENLDLFFSEKNKKFNSYQSAIFSQESIKNAFVDLLCYSRSGCQVLSRRPSLLDLFFLRRYDVSALPEQEKLNALSDIKMVAKILSSIEFSKNKNIDQLGMKLSQSYEEIIKALISEEEGLNLVFLGKMATQEIGSTSDLDFIITSTELGRGGSKKAREFYKKISFSTIFGPLVPFDRDAGPMGSATPMVMSHESLEEFLSKNADPWVRLMYLRHRFLFKSKRLEYLSSPIPDNEIDIIFEILQKKISVASKNPDRAKFSKGGLFHTEYLTGALFLKLGVQPKENFGMSDFVLELSSYYKDKKSHLLEIGENYNKLRLLREESFLNDLPVNEEAYTILTANAMLLQLITKEIFNKEVV